MIRQAKLSDFTQLKNIYEAHAEEAKVAGKLSFDADQAIQITKKRMIDQISNILIYSADDKIVGYCVVSLAQLTWNEVPVGSIEMFYIHPDYRLKISSHKFLDQIEEYLRENDCELMMGSVFLFDQQYQVDEDYVDRASKYFEKKGMKWCGNVYIKEL